MLIYSDGGTLANGTPKQWSRIAVYALGKIVVEKEIGNFTNNEAEYQALIAGLEWAKENHPDKEITFLTDSQLIFKQVTFRWGCSRKASHLKPYINKSRQLLNELGASIRWVPREKNLAGHYLEDHYEL